MDINMQELGQRIKEVRDHYCQSGSKNQEFLRLLGMNTQDIENPAQTIAQICSGATEGVRFIELILARFQKVNREWLMWGRGDKWKE